MARTIGLMTLVVRNYDEAIDYYVNILDFILVEDSGLDENKRWVVIAPKLNSEFKLLLAQPKNEKEAAAIGNQTGGRVFLFLYTDDLDRDYKLYRSRGVKFVREIIEEYYGKVAVFEDLYGNLWDLIEPKQYLS
ncbi:MAG: VOC family protein [Flavobacteriaceae bacterium]|nr:VOC family protein [Flavobacteriaceae bacterium]